MNASILSAPLNPYLVPERKPGFFVKIKPPAPLPARRAYRPEGKSYAPEGKTKILTTPVRSAGPTGQAVILLVFRGLILTTPVRSAGPTGQAVILVVFRGLTHQSSVAG